MRYSNRWAAEFQLLCVDQAPLHKHIPNSTRISPTTQGFPQLHKDIPNYPYHHNMKSIRFFVLWFAWLVASQIRSPPLRPSHCNAMTQVVAEWMSESCWDNGQTCDYPPGVHNPLVQCLHIKEHLERPSPRSPIYTNFSRSLNRTLSGFQSSSPTVCAWKHRQMTPSLTSVVGLRMLETIYKAVFKSWKRWPTNGTLISKTADSWLASNTITTSNIRSYLTKTFQGILLTWSH